MTAISSQERPGRPHEGCDYLAKVKEFTNMRRLIFCTKCDLLLWEDVEE